MNAGPGGRDAHAAGERNGLGEPGDDRGHDAAGREAAEAGHAAGAGVAAASAGSVGRLGPSLSRAEEAAAMAHGWSR